MRVVLNRMAATRDAPSERNAARRRASRYRQERATAMAHRLLRPLPVLDMTETDQTTQSRRRSALTPGAPAPLYQQLCDLLRAQIKSGVYGPLDRLPSEHELAREHSISRITARQALGQLERSGLVFRLQGRGSFVARPAVVQGLAQLSGFVEAMSAQGLAAVSRVLRVGPVRAATDVAERLRAEPGAPLRLTFAFSKTSTVASGLCSLALIAATEPALPPPITSTSASSVRGPGRSCSYLESWFSIIYTYLD